jgi:acetyl-CoA carboxylase biotin carboxyl carrier protein
MSLSYKEVAEILKIIDASSCEEVVLELENTRLVVRRGGTSDETKSVTPKTESDAPALEKQVHSAPSEAATKDSPSNNDDNEIIVKSPMAGTFYSRPSPDEASFVSHGTKVTSGDTLCLIEVMKLYTTIEATADGVIESVLVEDGNLVEFDQPLFVISSHDS